MDIQNCKGESQSIYCVLKNKEDRYKYYGREGNPARYQLELIVGKDFFRTIILINHLIKFPSNGIGHSLLTVTYFSGFGFKL